MLTKDEIRKFLETSLATRSNKFETVESIEEEKNRKLFKSIVDLAEVLIVNEQVTVDSWNLANNNTDISICLLDNMKAVVNNIVKNCRIL